MANPLLNDLVQPSELRHTGKWLALAGLVGLLAGLGAIVFQSLSQELFELMLGGAAHYHPRPPGGEAGHAPVRDLGFGGPALLLLMLLPGVGGFLSGWLVQRFAPEAAGHGTDAALEVYHQKAGLMKARVPIVKTLASILTLGFGGSGGREGPIAQIGAGIGSVLATKLGLSVKDRRILLAAGMAAGVGAIFRAPLAGALFASEIHYKDPEFEAEAVIPSAISSIVAYCVFSFYYGWQPLFHTADFVFRDPLELVPYTVLAVAVSIGAWAFVRVFDRITVVFAEMKVSESLKPAIGGLLTGVVALLVYAVSLGELDSLSVLGFGYGALQGALDGQVGIWVLLLVAFGKMLTTSLTIGSGGSGGVFGPSMVIGGALGGAVGLAFNLVLPDLVPNPGAFVFVGMAGFFAGAANTPISTLIMVSEMTGNYNLLLPALWVTTISYLLLRRVSLYSAQVQSRVDSPAHRGDFELEILHDMKVGDVYRSDPVPMMFRREAHLGRILHEVSETHQNYFPILDDDDKMIGVFSLNDVREFMYDESMWNIAIAEDFAVKDVVRVTPADNLDTALRRFTRRNIDELPVVDEEDLAKVVGLLRRKDVVDAYNRRLWSLQQEEGDDDF
jgi:CIC family chloride channel protein